MISLLFIKASLVILVGLCATFALRTASAALRSACWTAVAMVLFALPVATRYAPKILVDVPTALADDPVAVSTPAGATETRQAALARESGVAKLVPMILVGTWLTGVALLLGGFVLGAVRARAIHIRATPVNDGSEVALRLRVLLSNLGVRRHVKVALSSEIQVPMTGGVVRPYIVLPGSSVTWDASRMQSVLVHETAHIARWDIASHVLFEIVRAIYWPNPLVWRAMARATMERERAADDRVLAGGANPATYAADLLDLASTVRQPMRRAALGIAASPLKTRIRAILHAGVRRENATPRQWGTIAAAGVTGLFPVAGLTLGAPAHTAQFAAPVTPTGVLAPAAPELETRQVLDRRSDQYFVTRSLGSTRTDSLLFVLINAKQPRTRQAAARSLRADGVEVSVVNLLVSALGDTCHGDRWLATRALRDLRTKRALPNLVRQLVRDEHVAVRSMAANAIAAAGAAEGAVLLETALVGAETVQVARVTRALETLGETPAHATLIDAVRRANH
jgi:beta-lactamase regulating signal transducer with metallopeptidase domain